jgi:LysR family glycine cleavage system transcriptional activator
MRQAPSLRGLQAFGAVAQTGNLSTAAELLGITASAVSHRIRGLGDELGRQLLRRTSKGLVLTAAGRRYRGPVEDAFTLLAQATSDLLGPDFSRPLTVSVTSEFGIRWLMPRFERFRKHYADIDIAILSTYELADLASGEADLALRYGAGRWPGLHAEPILQFAVSPVCAPPLLNEIRGLSPAQALARSTLIHDAEDDWETWLDAAGAAGIKPAHALRFADYSMALTAAINGQGIVLGYFGYVETEISAGLLVQPFELKIPVEKGYYLVYPAERLADPRVRSFRDWVAEEIRSQQHQKP